MVISIAALSSFELFIAGNPYNAFPGNRLKTLQGGITASAGIPPCIKDAVKELEQESIPNGRNVKKTYHCLLPYTTGLMKKSHHFFSTLLPLLSGKENLQAFHTAVREAISDGKLTEEEIAALEEQREHFGLNDDDLGAVRMELYLSALSKVRADDTITDDEWQEMEQIQDYLGLQDRDIEKTKKELYRQRIMSEIKRGNMPVIGGSTFLLKSGEIPYWKEPVTLFVSDGKKSGDKKWKKAALGNLLVTNNRLIFHGKADSFSVLWRHLSDVQFSVKGVVVQTKGGTPRFLQYRKSGNHNIVGSIIAYAHAIAVNG